MSSSSSSTGGAQTCDDGNPCTVDTLAGSTCVHTPLPAGSACDDGIACTTNDVCDPNGHCAGTVTTACAATGCATTTPLGGTIDIPLSVTSATVTLGGQPLPAGNEYGSDSSIYLVAKDTGEWHLLADWVYNGTGNPAALYGPTVNPRVVPGVYDIYYCHNCSTSTTTTNISSETDAADAFPNGLRILQKNVVVGAGAAALSVDVPVANMSATVTLGGQPLPAGNEYGSDSSIYLVAQDTGQWHLLADWVYNGTGNPAALYGPTVNPRVVPGTYDVYYCHNCSTMGSTVPISSETDAADAFPNGLRMLKSGLVITPGSNHVDIDIPVAQVTATVTLGGQPLPTGTEYGSDGSIYLAAPDTGEWHLVANWVYNGTGTPAALYGPTVNPRVVPGTYDVYYCHNCSTSTKNTNISSETDVADAFPNGLRVLQRGLVVNPGANHLSFDIGVAKLTATVTLGGQPLPAGNEYGSNGSLYLVAKDTGQWHLFADWVYNGTGNPAALYGPTVNPRVVPGTYDIYYCHNCSTMGTTQPISSETDAADAFPNGLRILQKNVVINAGANALAVDIPVAQMSATVTLGGQALPSGNEYGSDGTIYLIDRETTEWHTLANWVYNGTGNPASLYGPTVNPRIVPGTYDVAYCHNCSTSTTATNISSSTDAADAFPNGLRILRTGVTITSGANQLAVDIPVDPTSEAVTLAGQPLPQGNEYGSDSSIYLVARDTGEWHLLADWVYNGTGNPASLYGPTVNPRVVPGTYDVYYCHNCSTMGATSPISSETDAADAFPNGLRALRTCVTVP